MVTLNMKRSAPRSHRSQDLMQAIADEVASMQLGRHFEELNRRNHAEIVGADES